MDTLNTILDVNTSEQTLDRVAYFLAKIAASQGHATPKHRFTLSATNMHGSALENLNLISRAKEIWLTLFADGEVIEVEATALREHSPALWIHKNNFQVAMLTGLLSNGSATSEEVDGTHSIFEKKELAEGKIFAFKVSVEARLDRIKPKSAQDWFIYAIKKRKGPFIEAVVASLLISILTLAVSFYSMQVYDRVVPTQGYSTLIVITIGALIAITLELITKQMRNNILDRACKLIDIELSSVFFGRMLSIRMDARPKTIGTFAAQIKQFELVRNFMTSSTLFVIADLPFVIFFIVIIWVIGGVVALVPLTLLPISIFVGLYAKWKLGQLSEEHLEESNQKNGVLVEAIDGIESIKAVGGEWKMLEHWKRLTASNADKELSMRDTTAITASLTQTIQQLSFVLITAAGVYAIGMGQMTMGALMACSIISSRALSPISQIAGKIIQWQHAKAALKGLDHMMKLPTDRDEESRKIIPGMCHGRIKADNISFAYSEFSEALHGIQLTINPGERIAIVGPVGSGKSTLIKLLSGLYKPSKGKVFLDEVDMMLIAPEFLRESIGYLTQEIRLFNGSLRYNLTIGLASPKDSVLLAACQQTGLASLIKNHPKGLELPIYEGGRGLSGGQKQLVGLTRMLIARPQILLLDEPTASMDGDLELKVIQSLFTSANLNATVLLSTHKTSLLKFVDRIIVLDKGKIVIDGKRDEVIARLTKSQASNQVRAA
jgi:ATP-binding cassette subfamily C protein LapB